MRRGQTWEQGILREQEAGGEDELLTATTTWLSNFSYQKLVTHTPTCSPSTPPYVCLCFSVPQILCIPVQISQRPPPPSLHPSQTQEGPLAPSACTLYMDDSSFLSDIRIRPPPPVPVETIILLTQQPSQPFTPLLGLTPLPSRLHYYLTQKTTCSTLFQHRTVSYPSLCVHPHPLLPVLSRSPAPRSGLFSQSCFSSVQMIVRHPP